MKNIVFIFILFLNILNSYAQYYKQYNWDEKPTYEHNLKSNQSSISIFDKNIVEFLSGKFSNSVIKYETHHYKIKVFDNNSITKFSNIIIPLNEVLNLIDIKVRVVDVEGNLIEFDKKSISELDDFENSSNYKNFNLTGVKINSIIEVMYTLEKQYNIHGNKILQKRDGNNFNHFNIIILF